MASPLSPIPLHHESRLEDHMATENDRLALLRRALDQTGELIAGTRREQADQPTPCRSWTVGDLIGHLVIDLDNFSARVTGSAPDWSKAAEVGDDWVGAFASGRELLDAAWASADLQSELPAMGGGTAPVLSRADQQIAELAVHGWDLARATGQSEDLDAEVGEHGLRWAKQNLSTQFRGSEDEGKVFGEEVPVPDGAPVYERLAGWFGRDPAWSRDAA
jgi:uncharacterized protein (TIGR03086 family)